MLTRLALLPLALAAAAACWWAGSVTPAYGDTRCHCADGTCAVWNEDVGEATAPMLTFDAPNDATIPSAIPDPQAPLVELRDPTEAFDHYGNGPPLFAVPAVLRVRMVGTADRPQFVLELLDPAVTVRRVRPEVSR